MSETVGLRENIVAIICEWWERVEAGDDVEQSLEMATIHELLQDRWIQVSEDAVRKELNQLGDNNDIQVTWSPSVGSVSVQGVTNRGLCQQHRS